MSSSLKRFCRSIQRVSGWSYQRVHNHLTQPGHHASTCDWCKQQLALVEAGNQEIARALGEEPAEREAQREKVSAMTYSGEPFAGLQPKGPK